MTERHFYEPAQGHRLSHDPPGAIVAPRPIARGGGPPEYFETHEDALSRMARPG